jgi:hypothetical protein
MGRFLTFAEAWLGRKADILGRMTKWTQAQSGLFAMGFAHRFPITRGFLLSTLRLVLQGPGDPRHCLLNTIYNRCPLAVFVIGSGMARVWRSRISSMAPQ